VILALSIALKIRLLTVGESQSYTLTGYAIYSSPKDICLYISWQMHMFSVGRGGAGNIRSPSQDVGKDHPQTVTILNEHAAVQAEYEQKIKKHHAESNPIVCPSDLMCCRIDTMRVVAFLWKRRSW